MSRVLVVEDDIDACLELADTLCNAGFDVGVAADSETALRILATADPLPDAILLDLYMPDNQGWELRSALKTDERYSHIPIIIVAANHISIDRSNEATFRKILETKNIL